MHSAFNFDPKLGGMSVGSNVDTSFDGFLVCRNLTMLIASMKFGSFLTPDRASKNDARHGIE